MTNISKPLWTRALLCLILSYSCLGIQASQKNPRPAANQTSSLSERFTFALKDFRMDHQGEVQTLNIKISVLYVNGIQDTAYPDFRVIARDVETLLGKYPNKTDYWEIVNKRLTGLILDRFPSISRVTSEIEVSPSASVPYLRSSTVTRERRRFRGPKYLTLTDSSR
jgi:hypothetical protein